MRISEEGKQLIRDFEGLRLSAYRDAVRKWEKTGRIPPYARQKLIMRWPERFHDIEFSPEASV